MESSWDDYFLKVYFNDLLVVTCCLIHIRQPLLRQVDITMLAYSLLFSVAITVAAAKPPNLVFILADDMGQWAAGAYGNEEIITPNIDRMASEGIRFDNAFCNTPVCSASRTSYFTGRLPSQHGVHDHIKGGNGCDGHEGIAYSHEETAYTDVLAKNGYTCGISGKYHLGDQPVPQHSFTHWFVHQSGGGSYINPPLVKDQKCVKIYGYITDIITTDAIEFISQQATSGKPFYASIHYTAPHEPYTGKGGRADTEHPKEIVDLYANCTFKFMIQEPLNLYGYHTGGLTRECLGNRQCQLGYYAAVTAMDDNIGRILNALKDNGIDDDTLVVFASDHGFNAGHHGLWGKGNAAYPLNMFDTSLKIPMIFRHTNTINPRVEKASVQVVDIAPTLLQYVGNYSLPSKANIAGESFADLLLSNTFSVFQEDRPIFGEYGQTRYARMNNMKFITRLTGPVELYDLENDPNEKKNLANTPNNNVHTMQEALRTWFSFYEDPFISGWTKAVSGEGQMHSVLYNESGMQTTPAFAQLIRF